MHRTLNDSGILTQSVHIPTCCGGGHQHHHHHHHHQGILLVSYNTAVETVCLVMHCQYNRHRIPYHVKFGGCCWVRNIAGFVYPDDDDGGGGHHRNILEYGLSV